METTTNNVPLPQVGYNGYAYRVTPGGVDTAHSIFVGGAGRIDAMDTKDFIFGPGVRASLLRPLTSPRRPRPLPCWGPEIDRLRHHVLGVYKEDM